MKKRALLLLMTIFPILVSACQEKGDLSPNSESEKPVFLFFYTKN